MIRTGVALRLDLLPEVKTGDASKWRFPFFFSFYLAATRNSPQAGSPSFLGRHGVFFD